MTAVDEIQAAIDKLMGIERGLGSDWRLVDEFTIEFEHPDGETYEVLTSDYEGIPAAIVTLHATIDAQLAILRSAVVAEEEAHEHWASVGKPHLRGPAKIVPINMAALNLARAINGATS